MERRAARSARTAERSPKGGRRDVDGRAGAGPVAALRSLLPRGYAGFTEATTPRHLVLPASVSLPLVVKLVDSPYRPPQFLMGAHGAPLVVDGDCARSYLEVWLVRDFRRLTGMTPTGYLAQVNSVQAAAAAAS